MRTVGVIGAGRVGAVLGAALRDRGDLVRISSRSGVLSDRARRLLGDMPVLPTAEIAADSDLLVITVPDDLLLDVIGRIDVRPGATVVHTSGRFGARILDSLAAQGAITVAAHPVMTFTGTERDLPRLIGCPWGVTSDDAERARALVDELRGQVFWIAEDDRVRYHAALSHASNHLVTLLASAMDLLRAAGVDEPAELIGPLVRATVDNVLAHGDAVLTGPVARGDASTVQGHLDALAGPDRDAYVAMARLTAERAERSGLLVPDARARIDMVLGSAT